MRKKDSILRGVCENEAPEAKTKGVLVWKSLPLSWVLVSNEKSRA